MDDVDGGGGGENPGAALGLLIVLIIGALIAIVAFIIEHREEIATALKWIARAIWKIHLALGRALLFVLRDLPVRYFWDDGCTDRLVRGALIFWLAAPVMLFSGILADGGLMSGIVWLILGKAAAAKLTTTLLTVCLWVLPSTIIVVYGYYKSYFTQPVRHYRWPRFVFHYELARTEIRLAWVLRITQVQIWLVLKKAALLRTCATWLAQTAARLDLNAAQLALSTSE